MATKRRWANRPRVQKLANFCKPEKLSFGGDGVGGSGVSQLEDREGNRAGSV